MDKDEALESVKCFSAMIKDDYNPATIILFGSYVRGDQKPSSDIDVAVIVDRIDGDFLDLEAGLYRKRREIDDRIEPILLEAGNDPSGFLDSIIRNGEVIYRRA